MKKISEIFQTQTGIFIVTISGWFLFAMYFGVQSIKYKKLKYDYQCVIDRGIKQAEMINQLNRGIEDISTRKNLLDTLITNINKQIFDLKNMQKYIINTLETKTNQSASRTADTHKGQQQMASIIYTPLITSSGSQFNNSSSDNSNDALKTDNPSERLSIGYQWKKIVENIDFLGIKLKK